MERNDELNEKYKVRAKDLKRASLAIVKKVNDPEKSSFALDLITKIDNVLVLEFVLELACNKLLLESDCYERVLLIATNNRCAFDIKKIKYVVCTEEFLNSKYKNLGLDILEKSTDNITTAVLITLGSTFSEKEKIAKLEEFKKVISTDVQPTSGGKQKVHTNDLKKYDI